jgi:hypothetical protein
MVFYMTTKSKVQKAIKAGDAEKAVPTRGYFKGVVNAYKRAPKWQQVTLLIALPAIAAVSIINLIGHRKRAQRGYMPKFENDGKFLVDQFFGGVTEVFKKKNGGSKYEYKTKSNRW